ncbi:MAG: MotA/TolQ/ExbB proton channel family protein [bacterium]
MVESADVTRPIKTGDYDEPPKDTDEEIGKSEAVQEKKDYFKEETSDDILSNDISLDGYGPRDYKHSRTIEFFTGKTGTTDAPSFLCFLIGIIMTVFWYVVFPVPFSKPSYFHSVFAERGFIPYIITLCFFWGLILLIFKGIRFLFQKTILNQQLFPPAFKDIKTTNVDKLMKYLKQRYHDPKEKIIVNRLWVALIQLKQLGKPEEVNNSVQYQSEIDYGTMESSYTIIKFLIWVTPILGFLGTVIGIGTAIGGFTEVVSTAIEISAIKGALQVVTSGLSTAFDTTLLGLIVSLVLMFVMSFWAKSEETFLGDIDNFFITQVLHRMRQKTVLIDGEEVEEGVGSEAKQYKKIIESAFKKYMELLETSFTTWGTGFSGLITQMGEKTQGINEQISATGPIITDFRKAMEDFSREIKSTSEGQKTMISQMDERFERIRPTLDNLGRTVEHFGSEKQVIDDKFRTWMQTMETLNGKISDNFGKINNEMNDHFLRIGDNLGHSMEKVGANMTDTMTKRLAHLGEGVMERFERSATAFEGFEEGQTRFFQETTRNFDQNLSKVADNIIGKFDNQLGIFEEFRQKQSEYMEKQASDMNRIVESITADMGNQSENIKKIADGVSQQSAGLLDQLSAQMKQLEGFSDSYKEGLANMTGELENISRETVGVFGDNVQRWFEAFSVQQSDLGGNLTQQVAEGVHGLSSQLLEGFGEQITTWFNSFSNDQSEYFNNLSHSLGQNLNESGGELLLKMDEYSAKVNGLVENLSGSIIKNQQILEGLIQQITQADKGKEDWQKKNLETLTALNKELQNLSFKHDESIARLSDTGTTFRQGIDDLTQSLSSHQDAIKSLSKQ